MRQRKEEGVTVGSTFLKMHGRVAVPRTTEIPQSARMRGNETQMRGEPFSSKLKTQSHHRTQGRETEPLRPELGMTVSRLVSLGK